MQAGAGQNLIFSETFMSNRLARPLKATNNLIFFRHNICHTSPLPPNESENISTKQNFRQNFYSLQEFHSSDSPQHLQRLKAELVTDTLRMNFESI